MQNTSTTYQTLLAGTHRKEVRLIINDNLIFGEGEIFSMSVDGALFGANTLSFGGCVSREIRVKFLPGSATIPRMAKLQPQVRLTNGTTTSEWLSKGTFYIDTREYDKETGTLTLTGYDAMLKAEATYIPAGDVGQWPLPMSTVASEICTLLGLTMDSRTSVRSDYVVQLPTGYSMREVLGGIAAAHAGNWIITDAGKLRLIKATDMISASTVIVGRNVVKYTDDQPFAAITHVEVDVSDELYVEAAASPDNGRLLRVSCPWGTQAIANNILSSLANFTYQPYEAEGAILDPAAEIGDKIAVNGITSYLAVQECTFNSLALSDIGAPSEDEIDHEYPYEAVGVREIKRKVNGVYAAMYVGPDSIVSKVETLSNEFDDVSGEFTLLEQKVDGFTLSAVDSGHTDTIDSDVGELEKDVIYAPSDDSTWFPFVKTSDDYYTSQNAGVDNSFAYGKIFFNFSSQTSVILKCISYGEVNYDYGIVSEVDVSLAQSRTADTTGVLYSFRTESSSTVKEVSVTVPAGSHYISFKYIKDSSAATGGDYFKIRPVTRRTVVTPQSTTVKLMSQGIEVSSATINFTGLVKFADLSGNGTTVINGANITTGMIAAERINVSNLHVTKVYYSDSDDYRILQGTVLGSLGAVELGIQNTSLSDAYIVFYGGEFVFAKYNDASAPMLRIIRNSSTIVGNNWELGTVQSPFDILTVKGVSLYDTYDGSTGSLTAYRGHLYFNNTIVI